MPAPRLAPGPQRDTLATLSEHARGGEWVDVHAMKDRLGVPYMLTKSRLDRLVEEGLAAQDWQRGRQVYTITNEGSELLK